MTSGTFQSPASKILIDLIEKKEKRNKRAEACLHRLGNKKDNAVPLSLAPGT